MSEWFPTIEAGLVRSIYCAYHLSAETVIEGGEILFKGGAISSSKLTGGARTVLRMVDYP